MLTRFATAQPIPGIRGIHSATPVTDTTIAMKTISNSKLSTICRLISENSGKSSRTTKLKRSKK